MPNSLFVDFSGVVIWLISGRELTLLETIKQTKVFNAVCNLEIESDDELQQSPHLKLRSGCYHWEYEIAVRAAAFPL